MSLDAVISPPGPLESRRFYRVSYLPTGAVLLFLLVLVWAGAPGDRLNFSHAWKTAAGLGIAEGLLVVIGLIVVALVLHPLQLALVRLIEGGWPGWLGSGLSRRWQLHRRRRLMDKTQLPAGPGPFDPAVLRAAGIAGTRLRQRFPLADHLVRATALGNALAAMEDQAGRVYGLDCVVAWPRLYLVLSERMKGIVDDRRDTMDAAARMAASCAVATVASGVLLWGAVHWWWLLALIPAVLSIVSYWGAVHAAVAYGEAVRTAFDLHRFDLLRSCGVAHPATPGRERGASRQLCDLWRQGVPLPPGHVYPPLPGPTLGAGNPAPSP